MPLETQLGVKAESTWGTFEAPTRFYPLISESLTEEIDRIDSEKARAIRDAKYPIEGLGFDVNGVTLNGIPFSQSSSAQQLKVSVAIGLALNPSLRVLLIRDGSLLDEKSLAMLGQMAEKAGAQVWVERVGVDDHTSVVIEDGQAWEVTT